MLKKENSRNDKTTESYKIKMKEAFILNRQNRHRLSIEI